MLSVIFFFSIFITITTFAAIPASQNELTATMTSSKTTYSASEDIDVSLTVTIKNAYTVVVDDVSKGVVETHTFDDVTENHDICIAESCLPQTEE